MLVRDGVAAGKGEGEAEGEGAAEREEEGEGRGDGEELWVCLCDEPEGSLSSVVSEVCPYRRRLEAIVLDEVATWLLLMRKRTLSLRLKSAQGESMVRSAGTVVRRLTRGLNRRKPCVY